MPLPYRCSAFRRRFRMLKAKFVRVNLADNHRVDPCAITGMGAESSTCVACDGIRVSVENNQAGSALRAVAMRSRSAGVGSDQPQTRREIFTGCRLMCLAKATWLPNRDSIANFKLNLMLASTKVSCARRLKKARRSERARIRIPE